MDVVALRTHPAGWKRGIGPQIPAYERSMRVIEKDEKGIAESRYRRDDGADVLLDAQADFYTRHVPYDLPISSIKAEFLVSVPYNLNPRHSFHNTPCKLKRRRY